MEGEAAFPRASPDLSPVPGGGIENQAALQDQLGLSYTRAFVSLGEEGRSASVSCACSPSELAARNEFRFFFLPAGPLLCLGERRGVCPTY